MVQLWGFSHEERGAIYLFSVYGSDCFLERDPDMRLISSHLDWHENLEMVQNWGFKI